MGILETSLEEERREVWESVLECLELPPDPDGQAACAFLLCHLASYHEPEDRDIHGYTWRGHCTIRAIGHRADRP